VKELPQENGLKRYELTQNGKSLLEEQKKIRQKFREQGGFMPGQFFDSFLTKIPHENIGEIRDSMKHLAIAMFTLGNTLREKYSQEALTEALQVVNETSKKLEEINKKLKGEKA
jgi:DNA-binding PadR family transcriptional regulator